VKIKTRRRPAPGHGWRGWQSREARCTDRLRARRVALCLVVGALIATGCRHASTTTDVAQDESRPAAEPPAPEEPERPSAPPERDAPPPPREPPEPKPPSPVPGPEDTSVPETGPAPPGPPPIDVDELVDRLKDTDAIGLFTKLRLKNELDDLTDALEDHFREAGGSPPPPPRLRERYDLLVMKVLAVLEDGDPELSHDLYRSRHLLWRMLADPGRYTES